MITEIRAETRPAVVAMEVEDFRDNHVDCIYGTIRLIERDDESFLAWAKQPYACTIFNLHTSHTPDGLAGWPSRSIDGAKRGGRTQRIIAMRAAIRSRCAIRRWPSFTPETSA
jgi:hypothetical protein